MRRIIFLFWFLLSSVQLVDMKNKRLLSTLQRGTDICLPLDLLADLFGTQQTIEPPPPPPDCGTAPQICGTTVTYDQSDPPTKATYKCNSDADNEVSGGPKDSFCNQSGAWTPVDLNCLGLVHLPEFQTQAQGSENCKAIGRTLLNIQRAEQAQVINDFMNDNSVFIGAWTGLEYDSSSGKFIWPDNRTFSNEDTWDNGDPDNIGRHNCVLKKQENKALDTLSCSRQFSALCSC